MERNFRTVARVWSVYDWATALWLGDQIRRQLYLGRDYRWATRQARIGEFEAAWSQRTKDARAAYRATLLEGEAVNDATLPAFEAEAA